MTTTDDILAAHIRGEEALTPTALQKVRAAQDFERLEEERVAHGQEVAEAARQQAELEAANATYDADLAALLQLLDQSRAAYAAAEAAFRDLDRFLDQYPKALRSLTRRAAELGRDTSALPRRINPDLIRTDLDRARRGIKPAHKHALLTPAPPAEDAAS